ncbi:MAG: hypothetical protein IT305_24100 [Chloroflexi bacterium]|nr:hypothetical protein [Chloroflexota bacterium]
MSVERAPIHDPRLLAVATELQEAIRTRYPDAAFEIVHGDDPPGLHLIPIVDVDDTEDVAAVVAEHLLTLQVDEGLPIYVFPRRPLARVLAERRIDR